MAKHLTHYINIGNKKYSYELLPSDEGATKVVCEAANIEQEFLNEDIPGLLADLPNLILAEKKYKKAQNIVIRFRVSSEDKKRIEKNATKKGYSSVSSFLRDLAING